GQVLGVGPGLLVAIRRGEGILAELPHLELSSPALAGDLAGIPASDLLSLLHQSRRTGILVASSGGIERCAVLIDGQVTWAASTSPAERIAAADPRQSRDELWKELDRRAIEIVFGLLASESGTFAFLRAPPELKL